MTSSSPPDHELILQVSNKDEDAFKELYSRYHIPVFNYMLRLVHQTTYAEDLLQEVFLAVWQGAEKFRKKSSVKTWIFRIAHYQAISWLRRHGKTRNLFHDIDEVPLYSQELSPEQVALLNNQTAQIQTAIERLSQNHRATIELTFIHGFSYKEIAEIMGCPVGTVKSRMNSALKYLNAEITREDHSI